MNGERRLRWTYILADFLSTNIAMLLFNIIRYYELPESTQWSFDLGDFLSSATLVTGQILFPIAMVVLYYLSGQYNTVYGKSRTSEASITLSTALIGTVVLIFTVLINDLSSDRTRDYSLFLILFGLLFILVYIPRYIISRHTSHRITEGKISFNTLVVGYSSIPQLFPRQLQQTMPGTGIHPVALIDSENKARYCTTGTHLPIYDISRIKSVCAGFDIHNIILIPNPAGWDTTQSVINRLLPLDLPIYVAADRLPTYMFSTQLPNFKSQLFIDVTRTHLPESTLNIKRATDVVVSALMLLITALPLLLMGLAIKIDTKGPVLYRQRRLGLHKKPFTIYKLRTMVHDAEPDGKPELSHANDSRITSVGRILRKYRLDELPQFFNVLRGDMSLVGPRPEREYFASILMEHDPAYSLIHRVRPGITSLGMVKYGYASSVEQMLERMRYDLIYLENISITTDLKILFHTASTVLSGKGL